MKIYQNKKRASFIFLLTMAAGLSLVTVQAFAQISQSALGGRNFRMTRFAPASLPWMRALEGTDLNKLLGSLIISSPEELGPLAHFMEKAGILPEQFADLSSKEKAQKLKEAFKTAREELEDQYKRMGVATRDIEKIDPKNLKAVAAKLSFLSAFYCPYLSPETADLLEMNQMLIVSRMADLGLLENLKPLEGAAQESGTVVYLGAKPPKTVDDPKNETGKTETRYYHSKEGKWIKVPSRLGNVKHNSPFRRGDVTFAETTQGIYAHFDKEWIKLPVRWKWEVNFLGRLKRDVYALSMSGLYKKNGNRWEKLLDTAVFRIGEINGSFYAWTHMGVLIRKKEQWTPILEFEKAGKVHEVAWIHKKLYAATDEGLFLKKGGRWLKILQAEGGVLQIFQIDEKLHAVTGRGLLLARKKNAWKVLLRDVPEIRRSFLDNGKLLLLTDYSVLVKEKSRWRHLLQRSLNVGRIYDFYKKGGYLVINSENGSFVLDMHGNWRKI